MQRILASQHDAGTVYVAYENHQNGDFKPYLIKSSDRGKSWSSIAGNLPERGGVCALAEDHIKRNSSSPAPSSASTGPTSAAKNG